MADFKLKIFQRTAQLVNGLVGEHGREIARRELQRVVYVKLEHKCVQKRRLGLFDPGEHLLRVLDRLARVLRTHRHVELASRKQLVLRRVKQALT